MYMEYCAHKSVKKDKGYVNDDEALLSQRVREKAWCKIVYNASQRVSSKYFRAYKAIHTFCYNPSTLLGASEAVMGNV